MRPNLLSIHDVVLVEVHIEEVLLKLRHLRRGHGLGCGERLAGGHVVAVRRWGGCGACRSLRERRHDEERGCADGTECAHLCASSSLRRGEVVRGAPTRPNGRVWSVSPRKGRRGRRRGAEKTCAPER